MQDADTPADDTKQAAPSDTATSSPCSIFSSVTADDDETQFAYDVNMEEAYKIMWDKDAPKLGLSMPDAAGSSPIPVIDSVQRALPPTLAEELRRHLEVPKFGPINKLSRPA